MLEVTLLVNGEPITSGEGYTEEVIRLSYEPKKRSEPEMIAARLK